MKAYCKVVLNTKYYGKGLEWDTQKNILFTPGVVTAHPETTLIQFLLENGCVEREAYIACSRLPCYASVRYVEVVNTPPSTHACSLDPLVSPLLAARPVFGLSRLHDRVRHEFRNDK